MANIPELFPAFISGTHGCDRISRLRLTPMGGVMVYCNYSPNTTYWDIHGNKIEGSQVSIPEWFAPLPDLFIVSAEGEQPALMDYNGHKISNFPDLINGVAGAEGDPRSERFILWGYSGPAYLFDRKGVLVSLLEAPSDIYYVSVYWRRDGSFIIFSREQHRQGVLLGSVETTFELYGPQGEHIMKYHITAYPVQFAGFFEDGSFALGYAPDCVEIRDPQGRLEHIAYTPSKLHSIMYHPNHVVLALDNENCISLFSRIGQEVGKGNLPFSYNDSSTKKVNLQLLSTDKLLTYIPGSNTFHILTADIEVDVSCSVSKQAHNSEVYGAEQVFELFTGIIISLSSDSILRLWSVDGKFLSEAILSPSYVSSRQQFIRIHKIDDHRFYVIRYADISLWKINNSSLICEHSFEFGSYDELSPRGIRKDQITGSVGFHRERIIIADDRNNLSWWLNDGTLLSTVGKKYERIVPALEIVSAYSVTIMKEGATLRGFGLSDGNALSWVWKSETQEFKQRQLKVPTDLEHAVAKVRFMIKKYHEYGTTLLVSLRDAWAAELLKLMDDGVRRSIEGLQISGNQAFESTKDLLMELNVSLLQISQLDAPLTSITLYGINVQKLRIVDCPDLAELHIVNSFVENVLTYGCPLLKVSPQ